MTLAETMDAIEEDEFAAEMNLAAGTKAFRRAIMEHDLFQRLAELAKENPPEVEARIEKISHLDIDERYENRFDTALSAYLMALSDVAEPEVVSKAATAVLRTPKCWWASGLAGELLLRTVAAGVGTDCREAVYVRVNNWLIQARAAGATTTMRELLRALSAGQPSGQGKTVIEFPSQQKRSVSRHHIAPKTFIKRKRSSSRPRNVANARARKQA